MNRREFLHSSALATGGLTLSLHMLAGKLAVAKVVDDAVTPIGDFIRIAPDGDVLFWCLKHEMGQGVATSMAQVLCEELDADWSKVRIDFPVVDLPRYDNERNGGYGTGGSCTLIYAYDLLRKAGATARRMLIEAAARTWNVSAADCRAENHWIVHSRSSRRASYGELAPRAARLEVPTNVPLKDPKRFALIGTSKPA
jgi:CO/xanthine dehydrogenase Mo-binding subunit